MGFLPETFDIGGYLLPKAKESAGKEIKIGQRILREWSSL